MNAKNLETRDRRGAKREREYLFCGCGERHTEHLFVVGGAALLVLVSHVLVGGRLRRHASGVLLLRVRRLLLRGEAHLRHTVPHRSLFSGAWIAHPRPAWLPHLSTSPWVHKLW